MRINIKPLSVNQAWKGRRYKTDAYIRYEKHLLLTLPKLKIPQGRLKICIEWGFSNKSSDIDNPIKCFLDILQKKYSFNDKMIYELHIKKCDAQKHQDYIDFTISAF